MKFNTHIGNLISIIFCFDENFSTPVVFYLLYRKRIYGGGGFKILLLQFLTYSNETGITGFRNRWATKVMISIFEFFSKLKNFF